MVRKRAADGASKHIIAIANYKCYFRFVGQILVLHSPQLPQQLLQQKILEYQGHKQFILQLQRTQEYQAHKQFILQLRQIQEQMEVLYVPG